MEEQNKNEETEKIKTIEIAADDVAGKEIEIMTGEKYHLVVQVEDFEFSL